MLLQMDCVTSQQTEKRKAKRGKAISPDLAAQMVEMYSQGIGIKTIAKELLGRESAKNTVRYRLLRNGVELRNTATTQDEATKERRYGERIARAKRAKAFEAERKRRRKPQNRKLSGLELFDHAFGATVHERQNKKAQRNGFKSEYHKRYTLDTGFRAKELCKRRFQKIVKGVGHGSTRMMQLIGCSPNELRDWIESQWECWMNWDNIGPIQKGNWQIDHIIPCSWFDHSKQDHLEVCWHYLNLRPICAVENNIRRANPTDLIETIDRLPSHPMKARMLQFASTHSIFHK